MISRVLAVIPARGGSKGVTRKNLRAVGGLPLIAHAIRSVEEAEFITRCVVSTEDEEIAAVARSYGGEVPFMRDSELATDTASSVDTLIHALRYCQEEEEAEYDVVVLLQPTTPFRIAKDIDATVKLLLEKQDRNSAITVSLADSCNPAYLYRRDIETKEMVPLFGYDSIGKRRQDLERYYIRNGAVYAVRVPYLIRSRALMDQHCLAHVMDAERSINIDTELELLIAEQIWNSRK